MPLVILEKIAYLIAASSSKKVFRLSDKAKPVGPWRGAWVIMIAARGPEMENGQTLCKYQDQFPLFWELVLNNGFHPSTPRVLNFAEN